MSSRYGQIWDGEWVHIPRSGIDIACCDCDLVHSLYSRVGPKGRVEVRFDIEPRKTAALRKAAKRKPTEECCKLRTEELP